MERLLTTEIKVSKLEDGQDSREAYMWSKVVTMGNIVEVTTMEKTPMPPPTQKINKDLYFDKRTGDVFEYKHGDTRADNQKGVRQTLARIRALINCNVVNPSFCRWLTFTYAENMTDTKRLYKDWDTFRKRFGRWCEQNGIDKPEYIAVVEPQGRGAWHLHVFFIWQHPAPFLDNNTVIAPLWGHGFTKTKAVTNVDNVGAYFSAYLGDMPLDEFNALDADEMSDSVQIVSKPAEDADGKKISKKIVKGGRLKLYPVGMNIIRYSRGVKRPDVEVTTYEEAQKKVCDYAQTYHVGFELNSKMLFVDGTSTDKVANRIYKDYYNKVRKPTQDQKPNK